MESDTRLATLYPVVKKWYGEHGELESEYGDFPLFWQELSEWEHWTAVYSRYMKLQDATAREERQAQSSLRKEDIFDAATGKRKSGWGLVEDCPSKRLKWTDSSIARMDGIASCVAFGLMESKRVQILQLRLHIEELTNMMKDVDRLVAADAANPNHPESPPPEFDDQGNRTNGARQRIEKALLAERDMVMGEVVRLNPLYDLGYSRAQITRKVYIPVKEHPDFNFMGLLIGPRGQTLQKMEVQTGCKITIRGKGCGSTKRNKEAALADEEDELHVFIAGDLMESVDKAAEIVNGLLAYDPVRWEEMKTKQLRTLAKLNGTSKDEVYCKNCGNPGHQEFECPTRHSRYMRRPEIRCSYCGDSGHITKDCKFKTDPSLKDERDEDFKDFMKDLGKFDDEEATPAASNEADPMVAYMQQQQQQQQQQQSSAARTPINFSLQIQGPSGTSMPMGGMMMPGMGMPAMPPGMMMPGMVPGAAMGYYPGQWGYPQQPQPPGAGR